MKANRVPAINFILVDEGGFAVRPNEPGGSVNRGISMQAYREFRKKHNRPEPTLNDLKNISNDEVLEFYGEVCDAIHFDELPSGLDYAVLDDAVNEGIHHAMSTMVCTSALGLDVPARIDAISDIRMAVKRRRKQFDKFGAGWTKRIVDEVPKRARQIAGMTPVDGANP